MNKAIDILEEELEYANMLIKSFSESEKKQYKTVYEQHIKEAKEIDEALKALIRLF